TYAGFQDQCFQPLSHLSIAVNSIVLSGGCKEEKHKKVLTSYFLNKTLPINTLIIQNQIIVDHQN
ncbi:hypothetical protein, partial [Photobacterium phosphoreum]|uniref:hypothetical protein n=1 Tax=Photobacterium phosphoreum TaxID=659 RepID=UPI0024B81C8B